MEANGHLELRNGPSRGEETQGTQRERGGLQAMEKKDLSEDK